MSLCGLDFGTSNTTLGTMAGGLPVLTPLEAGRPVIPTAIFYDPAGRTEIGRAGIGRYIHGHPGRLMRSLKSTLGSALLDEATQVGIQRVSFREVIARYVGEVKQRAEQESGTELAAVVCGRPVHFVDADEAGDRKAEDALERIARAAGFADVSFQFEPIAAALDYERQVVREEIALIADIGGGTSDFSIVRLSPDRHRAAERADDILANDGVRIGGTDFDQRLSLGAVMPLLGYGSALKRKGLPVPSGYFHDLATWSSINRLYDPRTKREIHGLVRDAAEPQRVARLETVVEEERGHSLAMQVEETKIALADAPEWQMELGWIEAGLGLAVTRADLVRHTQALADRIKARIDTCLAMAGLPAERIDAVFLTGGSTRLAHVHAGIVGAVPQARVVEGDLFGSVGTGLTLEAARRYGRDGRT